MKFQAKKLKHQKILGDFLESGALNWIMDIMHTKSTLLASSNIESNFEICRFQYAVILFGHCSAM